MNESFFFHYLNHKRIESNSQARRYGSHASFSFAAPMEQWTASHSSLRNVETCIDSIQPKNFGKNNNKNKWRKDSTFPTPICNVLNNKIFKMIAMNCKKKTMQSTIQIINYYQVFEPSVSQAIKISFYSHFVQKKNRFFSMCLFVARGITHWTLVYHRHGSLLNVKSKERKRASRK